MSLKPAPAPELDGGMAPTRPDIRPAKTHRVAVINTHPIQYFAPLYRWIQARSEIDLTVYYCTDAGVRTHHDREFGVTYQWDTPLLGGYRHVFLREGGSPRSTFTSHAARSLSAEIAHGEYDAVWVHAYSYALAWVAVASALAHRTPVMIRGEGNLFDARPRRHKLAKTAALRSLVAASAGVLYIGESNREYWQRYGAPDSKLFRMPYCVDNEYFRSRHEELRAQGQEIRRSLGIADSAPVMLAVGKLIPRKAPLDLLSAFAQVRGQVPCHLLFAGEGELRGSIEREVVRQSIPDVHISGFLNQRDIARAYAAADVLALPSHQETWGLVVNEAMNFGLPVVATDRVGCVRDLVQHGMTGYVYRTGDVEELAAVLTTLVSDENMRRQLGESGRGLVGEYGFETALRGLRLALEVVS